MIEVAVYDSKLYDRDYLSRTASLNDIVSRFHEFRLSSETALKAKGALAVCVFVNDHADRACLEALATLDVKLLTLRCAGHNNLDLVAARDLSRAVVRVPTYSPHAVAEHTVGLLLTLNRKIHRDYNRVRELIFSLNGLMGFDIHGKTVGIVGIGNAFTTERKKAVNDQAQEVLAVVWGPGRATVPATRFRRFYRRICFVAKIPSPTYALFAECLRSRETQKCIRIYGENVQIPIDARRPTAIPASTPQTPQMTNPS